MPARRAPPACPYGPVPDPTPAGSDADPLDGDHARPDIEPSCHLLVREQGRNRRVAAGRGIMEIAQDLDLTGAELRRHLANARMRLGARNLAQKVATALRIGLHY